MEFVRFAVLPLALAATLGLAGSAAAETDHDPLKFFEGKTISVSTVKTLMHKPYETTAVGTGKIRGDGSLELVQRVERDGHPTKIRRWSIHRAGAGRFTGTMNEAVGPVTIEEVGGRYRFRFKMKGRLSVEQWLTPSPGWRSASNRLTVKKLGIKVGSSEGSIRKVN